VTVPQVNRVASNGILLSETIAGTDKIYHWKTKYPIAAYLIAIAVTNYSFYSDYVTTPSGTVEVLNYVYPEDYVSAQALTPSIIGIIKLYDSLITPYPFANEKYGHAQFGWGGGMEHQTMSFMAYFGYGLMAHECAHQWFGDHITCGSWQDIWLNEGFATYFQGLTEERYFPGSWMTWKTDRIDHITSESGGSVFVDDTTNVSRIFNGRLSYNKGAYLLHMLRWKLGDLKFFQSLKNYLNDPLLAGGYAKTPHLKAHLEAVSAMDLTEFFNDWYYNQGYPSYNVLIQQNGNSVNVTLNQSQSHSSVSFFEMPVPIKFIGTAKDTTIIFDHTYTGQIFTTSLSFPVVSALFDPERWILSAKDTVAIGIQDHLSTKNEIFVYPNPAINTISISINLKAKTQLAIEIFDMTGRKVYSALELTDHGKSLKSIDTQNLAAGIYELKISGNELQHTQKIVKN
jgi:aminopeptidase N